MIRTKIFYIIVLLAFATGCKKIDDPSFGCAQPTSLRFSDISSGTATISWNSSENALGYEYTISQSADKPFGSGTLLTGGNLLASGLSSNTTYYFHIRTKCADNKYSEWITTNFTTKDDYVTYIIKAGNNYMEGNTYPSFSHNSLKFKAIFDSSCIYSTVDPTNQADICKLYGFADNNSFHQVNSARFGWNWLNDSLRIHAYCYVNSVRIYKELGTVPINSPSDYSLEVIPGKYIFTLNGKVDTMDRFSMDAQAIGYRLYPYFGGDEPAPHDIRIRIKDLN